MADLRVTLIKSPIGNRPEARATVQAMGLRRLHQSVTIPDNESVRGMVNAVSHLVRVETGRMMPGSGEARQTSVTISKSQTTDGPAQPNEIRVTQVTPTDAGDSSAEDMAEPQGTAP